MIYLTGATGQLGFELERLFRFRGVEHASFDRQSWDITNENRGREILRGKGSVVLINCAAYTAVDRAESEPDAAYGINSEGTGILKRLCRENGHYLIHISTDFVFGGESNNPHVSRLSSPWRTDDPVSPRGVYARSKSEGERRIMSDNTDAGREPLGGASIIRTSWVYSSHGKNFPKTILRLAAERDREGLNVVEDQIGRPTWAGRIAEFIYKYIQFKKFINSATIEDFTLMTGDILHFSNSGIASWYDFAHSVIEIGNRIGLLEKRIPLHPIPSEGYPTPAPRPAYSVLDLKSAEGILPSIPHWRDDLEICLRQMMGKESP